MQHNGSKNVLLRERKRHTARRVAGICCVALSPGRGVPLSSPTGEGVRPSSLMGVPHPAQLGWVPQSCPRGMVPPPLMGVPSMPLIRLDGVLHNPEMAVPPPPHVNSTHL